MDRVVRGAYSPRYEGVSGRYLDCFPLQVTPIPNRPWLQVVLQAALLWHSPGPVDDAEQAARRRRSC